MDRPHPTDGAAPARPAPARRPGVRRAPDGAAGDGDRAGARAEREEIEAERLRAFRETARRVAHEMKNPLTPIRLAVAHLARSADARNPGEAIEVLTAEAGRLEQLAREFTEFGRLPEGPAAAVDLAELLEELARTSMPPTMTARLDARPGDAASSRATTIRCVGPSATSSGTRSRPCGG